MFISLASTSFPLLPGEPVAPLRHALTLGLALSLFVATRARAQSLEGSTGATLAGAGLGIYSGVTLGLLGAMLPCGRTLDGRRCVVSAASTGAALGIAMGGIIGSQDTRALRQRFRNAGWGSGAGAVLGLGLMQVVDRYHWEDAGILAFIGGGIGAAPYGSLVGAGAGAVVGTVAWVALPDGGVQDFLLATLAGMALGGMLDWADGAATKPVRGFSASFSIAR